MILASGLTLLPACGCESVGAIVVVGDEPGRVSLAQGAVDLFAATTAPLEACVGAVRVGKTAERADGSYNAVTRGIRISEEDVHPSGRHDHEAFADTCAVGEAGLAALTAVDCGEAVVLDQASAALAEAYGAGPDAVEVLPWEPEVRLPWDEPVERVTAESYGGGTLLWLIVDEAGGAQRRRLVHRATGEGASWVDPGADSPDPQGVWPAEAPPGWTPIPTGAVAHPVEPETSFFLGVAELPTGDAMRLLRRSPAGLTVFDTCALAAATLVATDEEVLLLASEGGDVTWGVLPTR